MLVGDSCPDRSSVDDERRGLVKHCPNELHHVGVAWVDNGSKESLDGHAHCSLQHLPPPSFSNSPSSDHLVGRNPPHLCVVGC